MLPPRALALVALLVLSASAAAQVANPGVEVAVAGGDRSVPAANSTTVAATVTSTGTLAGSVTLNVPAPAGWTVEAEPATFPLAAGASQDVVLTLTAPEAGSGAASAPLTLTATFTEDSTGRTVTGAATLNVARVDPAPVVAPPAGPDPLFVAGGIALGFAALAAVAVVVVRRRRRLAAEAARAAWVARETGVAIALVDGPLPFGQSREAVYRVAVTNTTENPRVAVVAVAERPEGWTVAISNPRIPLSPGERVVLTVYAKPEDHVAPGTKTTAILAAKPEEAREADERVTLDLVAPEAKGPATAMRGLGDPWPPRPILRP